MKRYRIYIGIFVLVISLLVPVMGLSYAQSPPPPATTSSQTSPDSVSATPLGTGFTYQGQLNADGEPVSEACEMAFRLYDAASGDSLIASPITATATISDGLFTQSLDFGAGAFNGDARWLGIRVQCPGDPAFTDLGRQLLAAAPYAHYAHSTGALHGQAITTTAPAIGEVLEWDGTAWGPALDDGTSYSAGVGLVLTDTTFGVAASYRLPQSCADGQIAGWNDVLARWECSDDGTTDFWSLTGNAGTTPGTHFLGTTDDTALEFQVGGYRAMRFEPVTPLVVPNIIGGAYGNWVTSGVHGATIGGGGAGPGDFANRVTDNDGTVSGGYGNQAGDGDTSVTSAQFATVGGGMENTASDLYATVGGGTGNTASGDSATVGGGSSNAASATNSTIGGGSNNTAYVTGGWAAIAGGAWNTTNGNYGAIAGGRDNTTDGSYTAIGGGSDNYGGGDYTAVSGGRENSAAGDYAAVGGGYGNSADGDFYVTIGGGFFNTADVNYATIGGGQSITVSGAYGTAGGGSHNLVDTGASYATIAGGGYNVASNDYAAVGGGGNNTASGTYAAVPGGQSNTAFGGWSLAAGYRAHANHDGAFVWADTTEADFASTAPDEFRVRASGGVEFSSDDGTMMRLEPDVTSPNVLGGHSANSVTTGAYGASIGGGGSGVYPNRVTDNYGTVGGGRDNQAGDNDGIATDAIYATVGGGSGNAAAGLYSAVGGGIDNAANGQAATVSGGDNNVAGGYQAAVAGGSYNQAGGDYSKIGGGSNNNASTYYTTVPGGYQASATKYGQMAYASGRFATQGDAQTSVYVLRNDSDGTDTVELFLDGSSQRLTLNTERTMTFDILIAARSTGNTSAGYSIQGVIENSGGTTQFIDTPSVVTLGEDLSLWTVAVVADDINDALSIRVTGYSGYHIHWVATVRTVEVMN